MHLNKHPRPHAALARVFFSAGLLVACFGTAELVGNPPPPPHTPQLELMPEGEFAGMPMYLLQGLLKASPEQLEQLKAVIGEIETMSAAEKENLVSQIQSQRQQNKAFRQDFRSRFSKLSPDDRHLISQYWRRLPREEARQLRGQYREMTPQQRERADAQLLERLREEAASGRPAASRKEP